MRKSLWILIALVIAGVLLILWGLLTPVHLRATDAEVLRLVAKNSPSLVEEGLDLVRAGKISPARMLLETARQLDVPGADKLERSVRIATGQGQGAAALESGTNGAAFPKSEPIMETLVPAKARDSILGFLETSPPLAVREIFKTRSLTNLVHFSPIGSPAGRPYDAVTLLTGLLLHGDYISPPLRNAIESLVFGAVRRGEVEPLERFYLDLMSLGNRLDWLQLIEFIRHADSLETFRKLAALTRQMEEGLPLLYSVVYVSEAPHQVVSYWEKFGPAGMKDLQYALKQRQGAVRKLVKAQERIHYANFREKLTPYDPFYSVYQPLLQLTAAAPSLAIIMRYLLLLVGAFLLALAGMYLKPLFFAPVPAEGSGGGRWLATPGQIVFVLSLVALLLFLAEPYLIQTGKAMPEFSLHWNYPMVGDEVSSKVENKIKPFMDQFTLLALVAFLVIQGVIYAVCLLKLGEIRRQPVSSELKLRLLENEENMFDAGLYAGLGGTVASLVLLAMGIIKPSLMAAYASTLFGIVFVAVLKICHLRPFRRQLILDGQPSHA